MSLRSIIEPATVPKVQLGVISIGNSLMGDDGLGIAIVNELRVRLPDARNMVFMSLERDLFEMADHVSMARTFIFVDSIIGDDVGSIKIDMTFATPLAPSNHQTDISTVMHMLSKLDIVDPFPRWEVWGITIGREARLGETFSPEVAEAIPVLVGKLYERCMSEMTG